MGVKLTENAVQKYFLITHMNLVFIGFYLYSLESRYLTNEQTRYYIIQINSVQNSSARVFDVNIGSILMY